VPVKGILVVRKPEPFAGFRRNEDLGRSVVVREGSSLASARTDDSGCPLDAEEGNVVGMRTQKAHAPDGSVRFTTSALG
jgi:hypothetical protein